MHDPGRATKSYARPVIAPHFASNAISALEDPRIPLPGFSNYQFTPEVIGTFNSKVCGRQGRCAKMHARPTEAAMNAIEQIRRQEEAARLQAAADYETLAVTLAKGETAPDNVLVILQTAGKTTADLEAAVNVAAERLRLKPLADSLPEVLSDRERAEQELRLADEKASSELNALQTKLLAHLEPLRRRVEELKQMEMESRAARSRLQHLDRKPDMARRFTPSVTTGEDE